MPLISATLKGSNQKLISQLVGIQLNYETTTNLCITEMMRGVNIIARVEPRLRGQGVLGALQVVTPGRTADEVQLPAIHAALNAPRTRAPALPLNNKETALPSLLQETTPSSEQPLFSVALVPLAIDSRNS